MIRPVIAILALLQVFTAPLAAQPTFTFDSRHYGAAQLPFNESTGDADRFIQLHKGAFEPIHELPASDVWRQRARPVGRLDFVHESGGKEVGGTCTATLLAGDYVLTNNHCWPANVRRASILMNYLTLDGDGSERFELSLKAEDAQRVLDYAVIKVHNRPTAKYGHATLSPAEAEPGQSLVIFHHPLGRPQVMSRFRCLAMGRQGNDHILRHRCDTMPGSSGSLIFSGTSETVALHHTGGLHANDDKSFNGSTRMTAILAQSAALQSVLRLQGSTASPLPAPAAPRPSSPAAAAPDPDNVAIVIGNKSYTGRLAQAKFAERDADAFAKAAREVLGVRPQNIVRVNDATGTWFQRWFGLDGAGSDFLRGLVRSRTATIYVYYSGQGAPAVREGTEMQVLLPVDVDPRRAAQEGFPVPWIREAVRRVLAEKAPEGRAVLIWDACLASDCGGNATPPASAPNAAVLARSAQEASRKAGGRIVELSASAADEVAYWDSGRQHSTFTDALLDGLYGLASDDGRVVTAGRLQAFASRRVSDRLASLYPGERKVQNPILAGDGDTIIATLSDPPPVRDPEIAERERIMCATLRVSKDEAEIRAFLSTCRHCACRATLEGLVRELTRQSTICRVERDQLDRLVSRGAGARAEIEALAESALCARVREAATAALAKAPPPLVRDTKLTPGSDGISAPPSTRPPVEIPVSPPRTPQAPCEPATGPSFRVTGVAANDVLYLRQGPNGKANEVARIPPSARGIVRRSCIDNAGTQWCEVVYDCKAGWVAARFLAPEAAGVLPPPPVPTAKVRVVNVVAPDKLYVRPRPGELKLNVGELAADATDIDRFECQPWGNGTWCRIQYQGIEGWVNARFIR